MRAQRDGRDIDPAVGVLRGEGALQRVKHLGPEHLTPRPDRLHDSTSEADAYYGLPALKEPVWRAWIPAYFYVGGLAGAAAVLLANTAVPVWQGAHRTLPPLFVASAASSAHAALEPFADCEAEARVLHRFGIAGKLAALTAMRALEREVGRSARAAAPLQGGVAGALWKSAKALFTLSLALTLLPGRKKAPPARIRSWKTLASSALATAGSLCLRFAVVQAGHASARDPRASFEPQRASLAARG